LEDYKFILTGYVVCLWPVMTEVKIMAQLQDSDVSHSLKCMNNTHY